MKKLLAVLMALVLMMCSVAFAGAVDPDYIADTMTSEDGTYKLAFVTDVGQLKDKSFNQGTWNGVKGYAAATWHVLQVLSARQRRPGDRRRPLRCDEGCLRGRR